MENIKRALLVLSLFFISCTEDPPTSTPIDPGPGPEAYFICQPGQHRNCTIEENIGVCQYGTQHCIGLGWSGCEQAVFPSEEVCDGLDNDCNGTLDEVKPLQCHPPGYEGLGLVYSDDSPYSICEMGYLDCVDGEWQTCEGYVGPENEACDGLDNNCNGAIDNDVDYGECGFSEEGMCLVGINYCIDGDLYCVDAIYPAFETCDNIDNDCDGEIDEDLNRLCETVCEIGQETCSDGRWVDCNARQPQEEVCDGLDNDCNGTLDEVQPLTCFAIQIPHMTNRKRIVAVIN